MVKVKNKKNVAISDKLHAKKTKAKFKKQLNPFEVHINKEKFKVLGKRSKNDRGLPGISRAKAIKKRKNTLGYELKLMNKSNTFLDKRIGEKNTTISEEDKIIARFAAEKIHQHKAKTGKLSKYNLAEDEILTHRGQTLEEIEKFDDPRSDDDEDDEDNFRKRPGHLQDNFVSDANFGGGVLSRSDNMDGAMSRKDLIEQLIIESKKRKLEKQKLKEETLDLTEKLDTEWKDLHAMVSKDFNKETEEKKQENPSLIDKLLSEHNKKNEEYDKTMRELRFEPRGTPSDRLKSEDEIAKIEKEKLEKLEKDRIIRMRGTLDTDVSSKSKYKSADDLDDDFQLAYEPEFMIAYNKEGKLLEPLKNKKNDDNNEEDDSSGEKNEDTENSDNDDEDNHNEQQSDDESDNESVDSLSDLRQTYVSSDEENDEPKTEKSKNKSNKQLSIDKKEKVQFKEKANIRNETDDENIKKDLLIRKEIMEKAQQELPFTFKMPKDYDELAELLDEHSVDLRPTIVDRIIKCNHPSLNEENKEKLGNLLAYLLQYINDLFSEENIHDKEGLIDAFKCFNALVSYIHTISQMDPLNAKNCVLEVIKEKYDDFKKNPSTIPSLDTLIFFQLVFFLFPTSDQKHPVVTPCVLFMSNILAKCSVKNSTDVSKGLFIVSILSSYVSLSKRFVPEAVNFIRGVLTLFVPFDIRSVKPNIDLPFKFVQKLQNYFVINENLPRIETMLKSLPVDFLIEEKKEGSINILVVTLRLLEKYLDDSKNYHCQATIFEKHLESLNELLKISQNEGIKQLLNNTKSMLEMGEKKLLRLVEKNKMPNTFKTFEPVFDTEFSGKKRRLMSKEKADYQKLLYKHKKEMKGALREIRRDKAFIGDVKIKEKLKSDEIRKQKVKRIFSEASLQQGELNALQRSKKKKK